MRRSAVSPDRTTGPGGGLTEPQPFPSPNFVSMHHQRHSKCCEIGRRVRHPTHTPSRWDQEFLGWSLLSKRKATASRKGQGTEGKQQLPPAITELGCYRRRAAGRTTLSSGQRGAESSGTQQSKSRRAERGVSLPGEVAVR